MGSVTVLKVKRRHCFFEVERFTRLDHPVNEVGEFEQVLASIRVRSCNIAFTRHGKCARAGPRAKLNGKDHPQFLGEGDETFMEDSGKNAILQDLTPYF